VSTPSRLPESLSFKVSRGSHRTRTDGTCLMELASVIGGEEFSARPHCVPPTLAAIARLVNDHVSDDRRQQLVQLLPAMMDGPGEDRAVGWLLVLSCLESAERLAPRRTLRRQRRRVLKQLARLEARPDSRLRWWQDVRFRVASFRAVYAATWLAIGDGDDALVRLLTDAVSTYTSLVPATDAAETLLSADWNMSSVGPRERVLTTAS
jgi:hypothetical protein